MKIQAFCFLIYLLITQGQGYYCDSDLPIGYKVKVAIPNLYSSGFKGKAFIMETETETDRNEPNFRAAITVEAMNEAYSCSIEIFEGDFKVWSSGHLLPFYTSDTCTLELNQSGDLQLTGKNDRLGWRSGTSGQGVERARLLKTGNLVLLDGMNLIKWQSFNFPTDVMLWDQSLSSRTRLTSFINDSSLLYYSFEIHSDKLALYLNSDKWKYSYWELKSLKEQNITFVKLTSKALEIFTGYDKKIAQITSKKFEPLKFLALENVGGNLGLYYYSTEKAEFEPYYQALNSPCDFPLACKPYEICTFSNSCSCLQLITTTTTTTKLAESSLVVDCNDEGIPSSEGLCGTTKAEMLMLHGVTSVLRSTPITVNVSQEACADMCLDNCSCASALYNAPDSNLQECYLYGLIRGVKQVEKESRMIFMVKVPKGVYQHHGKGSGLKKWIVILIGVGDGFIVVVIGGTVYYIIQKRRKNSINGGHPP